MRTLHISKIQENLEDPVKWILILNASVQQEKNLVLEHVKMWFIRRTLRRWCN